MVDELPTGYYLDNFSYVLDYVSSQYVDLLTPEELAYRETFHGLNLDARRLYVRMCSRRGPLFRDDKLVYNEIDTPAAVATLLDAGYADEAGDVDATALLALPTRPELAGLAGSAATRSMNRAQLVDCLSERPVEQLRENLPFRVLRPLHLEMLQTYRLLFFGNLHQDFTEFVLHDLGISPFEPYEIHPEDRLFDQREILDLTLALHGVAESAAEAIDANDLDAMLAAAALVIDYPDPGLQRRAGKIRNRIARQLERLDMADEALALYARTLVAPSRERRARLLHKQGQTEDAIGWCRDILARPEDEAEYEFAAGFARRILAKDNPVRDSFPDLRLLKFESREIVVQPSEEYRVEELARQWFEGQGNSAWYVENSLFSGLFGLAFWDIIFAARKGVFFNPFQRGPADLFEPEFRIANQARIHQRLAELAEPACLRHRVLATFNAKYGFANWLVNWHWLSEALLEQAIERIPATDVLAVFRRLLRDLKRNRAGFPDLVVFPADGGYLLSEIKGPGDTLQDNQKRWLRYFAETGIPAEVAIVSWSGA